MATNLIFTQESLLIEALLSVLIAEQKYLINNDIDAIDGVLLEKDSLLMRLQEAGALRLSALSGLGYPATESGMQAWLEVQTDVGVRDAWLQFQQDLAKAQELNRLNGTLISKHFNRNQQWIGHFQGAMAGDGASQELYTSVGQNPFSSKKTTF
jgi:flagella synthesis protein FlgN